MLKDIYWPELSTVPIMELDIYWPVLATVPSVELDIYRLVLANVLAMEPVYKLVSIDYCSQCGARYILLNQKVQHRFHFHLNLIVWIRNDFLKL